MDGDSLRNFLDLARRELPDVANDVWQRIEQLASDRFGGCYLYVNSNSKKADRLAVVASMPSLPTGVLAARLGCTPRRVQQLRKLLGEGS